MIENRYINIYESIDQVFDIVARHATSTEMYEYFEKYANEDNFDTLSTIMDSFIKLNDNSRQKYARTLLWLFYNESVSITEVEVWLKALCDDADVENVIEKITLIAAIESGLIYVGPKDSNNMIKIQRQKKLIDHIPRVYYGRKDIVSYKDENNIKNETLRIAKEYYDKDVEKITDLFDGFTDKYNSWENNPFEDAKDGGMFGNQPEKITPNISATTLMTVNNRKSLLEDYIPQVSLILNKLAVSIDDNETKYIDDDESKMDYHIISNVTFTLNYFKKDVLKEVLDRYYVKDNDCLRNLLQNIMQRTINYNLT